MATSRDYQIIDFLNEYKIASTSTIAQIFFNNSTLCYKRLAFLYKEKLVKRTRQYVSQEYLYHVKKDPPKQLRHSLLVTDFYRELYKRAEILNFKLTPEYGDKKGEILIPDAAFGYRLNGKPYIGFLEVEISNKGFNYNKYEKFFISERYKSYNFPIMPTIFVVGDKVKLPDKYNCKYKVISTDFSNFKL